VAQPLGDLGAICRAADALLYVDTATTLGVSAEPVDDWQADIVTAGLQKCMAGPPGSAPITLSDRAAMSSAGWLARRKPALDPHRLQRL
jgi:(S)-ureidoglycine-glyoxylate aminotransferase